MELDQSRVIDFQRFATMRKRCNSFIDSIAPEKLMIIPDMFNNNIFWQAGHLVAVQASLFYKHTNQKIPIDEKYIKYFGKGTSPNDFDDDIIPYEQIRFDLDQQLIVTKKDLIDLVLLSYDKPIIVSTGHEVSSFSDALSFISLHEAYHFCSMRNLSKFF